MATYSPALLDEIRTGVDIVDVVSRFVNLKKAGVNWKGLCPFHAEKTPSFTVNPKKGIFHCFGCGVGGDAFTFVQRQDKLTFPEAVRALAKSAGIALPAERSEAGGGSGREELLRVMELASKLYVEELWKPGGERARRYLDERGIDPELARRFGLGFAPESWDFLSSALRSERVSDEVLVTAGLVAPRQSGHGVYDRFRNRLLFAIRDLQGRVVAFGGRAFGDEQPKYLNSPETPLYTKGHLLYAADLARDTMRERNRALLVEGYVDCLMAHQYGFTETVAALGTAFTNEQIWVLRRYCDEVVTFFDADTAGQKAAERAEELLDSTGGDAIWDPVGGGATWAMNRTGTFKPADIVRVRAAVLPAGHDPDTFLRAEGADAFATRIAQARSLLSFALDRAVRDVDGGTGPVARRHAFARVALMLAKVSDPEEAARLSREGAFQLGVDAVHLLDEARKLQAALGKPTGAARSASPSQTGTNRERDLMLLILHSHDARADLLPIVESADIEHPALRAILEVLKTNPDALPETLIPQVSDEAARNLLGSLLVNDREIEDVKSIIDQFRTHLQRQQRLRKQREITRTILQRQESTGIDTPLTEEFRTLHRESSVVYGIAGGVAQSLQHGEDA